jgi:hypothetical protein
MLDGKRQFIGQEKSQGKIRDPQDLPLDGVPATAILFV